MPATTERTHASLTTRPFEQEELFPIREVARLTGINPVTLRAWERRYGLIVPARTDSGHRLYSMTDIETVRHILSWIERGVAVSKVGKILAKISTVQALSNAIPGQIVHNEYAQWQPQLKTAISEFDVLQLERVYGQMFSSYALNVVFQDILMPLWKQLLQQQEIFGQTSEWLLLDGFLRATVVRRLLLLRGSQPQRIVLAAIAGQCRELELLVAALLMGSAQVEVRVLTIGQPFEELTLVCEKIKPLALVLFSNQAPAPELPRRLNRLAMTLNCPVMLAGDAADLAQESLAGSSIGCLGSEGQLMQQRLQRFLAGALDT
ncbi:MerR family transcriptional regulator [Pseudomonas sp. H11T01]|uniref:MerR family transcriptional regulator n=1 Tax=Pseudomonas sp. H11T01 TaxID=3402749 RepID=UPI003AD20382